MSNSTIAAEDVIKQINTLLAEYPQLAEDEELLKDTLEGNTRFNEVMERFLSAMRENEVLAEAVSQRIGKLRERQTRLTRRAQFYRALMLRLMEWTGLKSVVLPEAKVSVYNSQNKVILTDESVIPDEYLIIKKDPNKTLIKKALNEGKHVPGATLSNGNVTLMVR